MQIDTYLSDEQVARMKSIPAEHWFTRAHFANAASPRHPSAEMLDPNNALKTRLVEPWIEQAVPGVSVLDAFSANGAFAHLSRLHGAEHVVGLEREPGRVEAAEFVIEAAGMADSVTFETGDIYDVASRFAEPFDVTLCLGGLYHIADPPHILKQLREVTRQWIIVQTRVLWWAPVNIATFDLRSDRTAKGLASIRSDDGAWKFSAKCVADMMRHAGFEVVDRKQPELRLRKKFPWWLSLARAV